MHVYVSSGDVNGHSAVTDYFLVWKTANLLMCLEQILAQNNSCRRAEHTKSIFSQACGVAVKLCFVHLLVACIMLICCLYPYLQFQEQMQNCMYRSD